MHVYNLYKLHLDLHNPVKYTDFNILIQLFKLRNNSSETLSDLHKVTHQVR